MYSDSGGGFFKPESVAWPNMGECVLIGLAGAKSLMGKIGIIADIVPKFEVLYFL